MWPRKTTDPLGKLLFEKYGMHVFRRPCEDMSVFQVFAVHNRDAFQSGTIDSFLRSSFEKPEVKKGEIQLDIDTTSSDAISANIGLTFLEGFLSLISSNILKSVSLLVEKSRIQALRFRFVGCTRDYVMDDFDLDWKLSETDFDKANSAIKEGYRYYIATSVHYCKNLSFEILDKNMKKIDFSGAIKALGGAQTGLTVDKKHQAAAASDRTLAYGVELNEIVYDEKRGRLELKEAKNYVHTKASTDIALPKAMVGGYEDLMVLNLVE